MFLRTSARCTAQLRAMPTNTARRPFVIFQRPSVLLE
jgi:hypothetical protein